MTRLMGAAAALGVALSALSPARGVGAPPDASLTLTQAQRVLEDGVRDECGLKADRLVRDMDAVRKWGPNSAADLRWETYAGCASAGFTMVRQIVDDGVRGLFPKQRADRCSPQVSDDPVRPSYAVALYRCLRSWD